MENYSYPSYPDSGNSSPRSREIDFENPPPWEDGQQPSYKVKFMCSYGGKIHPRPHDNQLSYNGGETKILSVDRSIRFSAMNARLSALSGDTDVAFKYQLPGEELDALISVTNDDDLEHLMQEYDRLYRSTARPARMRLFLFPANPSGTYGSVPTDRDHFVEALNSGPAPDPLKPATGNADFLFGREKGVPAPSPPPQLQPVQTHGGPNRSDSGFGPDPNEIQRQLQELQRLQISEQVPEVMYRGKSDDNMAGGFASGDYYVQKMPEKVNPATAPQPVSGPASYWHDKQQIVHGGQFSGTVTGPPTQSEQPMYVIHGHGGVYQQPPLIRQMSGQPGQGYYAVHQRVPSVGQLPQTQLPPHPMAAQQHQAVPLHHQQAPKVVLEGMGATRQGGVMVSDGLTYFPVGYDTTMRRQVLYAAGGGVGPPTQQYQGMGMGAVTAAMETSRRSAGPGG